MQEYEPSEFITPSDIHQLHIQNVKLYINYTFVPKINYFNRVSQKGLSVV